MKFVSSALFLVFLSALPAFAASVADKEQEAVKAAQEFLALIDAADYAQSWDVSARFFKQKVAKESWIKEIEILRPKSKTVIERKLRSAEYSKSVPGTGIPEGEYVVIVFDTILNNKQGAIEIVTPTLEPDGHWRVSGFFVR